MSCHLCIWWKPLDNPHWALAKQGRCHVNPNPVATDRYNACASFKVRDPWIIGVREQNMQGRIDALMAERAKRLEADKTIKKLKDQIKRLKAATNTTP